MLPISGYPSVVDGFLPRLVRVFTRPQMKHFAQYLTGLIVCENRTVTGINSCFIGRNDQSALNHWLTDADWSEEELDMARKELILDELNAKRIAHGVLLLDDTFNHKTGSHIEAVNIHYDHVEKRYGLGHKLVTSHLVAGRFSIPLDYELYMRDEGQEGFRSKQELARILIGRAAEEGFPFDCVVMDTWYFNGENTDFIDGLGKDWVAGCKSNRLILTPKGWSPIVEWLKTVLNEEVKDVVIRTGEGERHFWAYAKNVTLKGHWRVRLVASYDNPELKGEPKLIATNRLDWDVKTILKTYLKRGKIDSFYRDAKQELGLEDYEVRKLRGIRRHWLMVFLAHALLQFSSVKGGPVAWIKASLKTVGSRCRYATLEVLKSFISLVMKLAEKLPTPEEILKLTLTDWKGLKTMYQMEIT
jgi:hypothetical protein